MIPGANAYKKNGLGIIGKSLYGNRRMMSVDRKVSAKVMLRPESKEIPTRCCDLSRGATILV